MVDKRYYEKLDGFSYYLQMIKYIPHEEAISLIGRGSDKCDFYFYRN